MRGYHGRRATLAAATCLMGGLIGAVAIAQGSGAAGGSFTEAQAAAGRAQYDQNCAGCHQANLSGLSEALPLAGSSFMSGWRARTAGELFTYVQGSMPRGNPGTLSAEAYLQITAFLLKANGAKAGAQPLAPDSTARIGAIANGQIPAEIAQAKQGAAPAAPAASGGGSGARQPVGIAGISTAPPTAGKGLTVTGTVKNYRPVTDEMLVHPAPGDWLMYRRNYQGWSSSPLTQITPQNVNKLQLKWSWAMNEGGANQVTPIVHDGIIYLSNTSNTVQALDGRNGELIWENRIGPVSTAAYSGTRSIAIYDDKVFVATTNAKLYALDARTGKIVWTTDIADGATGYSNTGGVMVMRGKVLAGLTGCSRYFQPTNCYISAYDAATGKRAWKFYTTALSGTPGGDSWAGLPDTLRSGGETWIAGTYDPDLNLTYWGAAQAKPWLRASRGTGAASALFTSSTMALDPVTGQLKWYFSHAPGESLDLDEVFERVLIDNDGSKDLFTIGKVGILWKLNRETGKFLDHKEMIFQNVFAKVDPKTGTPTYRDDILNQKTNEWIAACPSPEGGKNWQAMSYNNAANLLIIPLSQSCDEVMGRDVERIQGSGGVAATMRVYEMPGTDGNMGRLSAIDPKTMKQAWSIQQRAPFLSAVLSTSGGVAFVGDFDRRFQAVDVKTGKKLWETRLGTTVQGYPVTYSIDGKQYVAVTTGLGGGSPQNMPITMLREVNRPNNGQQLYVFALPDQD